jgi:hypothetical protein
MSRLLEPGVFGCDDLSVPKKEPAVRRRFGLVSATAATGALAFVVGVGASAPPAALPVCPTQRQLEQDGATASEVSSPPQMSTGTFPVAANLTVPDEQCSYQGTLSLLLLYWQLSPAQLAKAKAHFQYLCKLQKCTVFLNKGSNTVVISSPGGRTKTKSVPTLNEVILTGKVNGEASTSNPPSSTARCDELARTLYSFVVGAGPQSTRDILEEFDCP